VLPASRLAAPRGEVKKLVTNYYKMAKKPLNELKQISGGEKPVLRRPLGNGGDLGSVLPVQL
jgi:hypothetical protein